MQLCNFRARKSKRKGPVSVRRFKMDMYSSTAFAPKMKPLTLFFATTSLAVLSACNPTLNWRDVRLENTRLSLLMPCRPDTAQKTVPWAGQPVNLTLIGCNADNATFAVSVADVKDASKVAATLAQWQTATLGNMRALPAGTDAPQVSLLKLVGADPVPPAVLVKALGRRADGKPVSGQSAYFAQGSQVFQAMLYADRISPEMSEGFFSSLKFE